MRNVIMVLLILALKSVCVAQSPELNDLHFNRLPGNNLIQDKDGYIWISSLRGLVRYDGYTTRTYKFGLEDHTRRNVQSIYEDRTGRLWLATHDGGLYNYYPAADTFLHYEHNPRDANSITAGTILTMHDDRKGNLWVLMGDGFESKGKRISVFDTKTRRFKHFDILEKNGLYVNTPGQISLLEDSRGHIWLGTNNGVCEYNPDTDKFILHFTSTVAGQQKSFGWLTEDPGHTGIIWMNVRDTKSEKPEGLLQYNTTDNTTSIYNHRSNDSTSIQSDSVYVICKDSQGRLWFGTEYGLSVLNPSSKDFTNYTIGHKKKRPSDNQVLSLAENEAGNFWVGNLYNLFLFDTKAKTFSRYAPNEKDPDAIKAGGYKELFSDRSGTLWVTTHLQGIFWLNRKRSKFMVYKSTPGQSHYFTGGSGTSFAEDKDGTFWVWSSRGLYHWFPASDSFASIKSMTRQPEDISFYFSPVLVDKDGIVWCSSGRGLYSYNPKTGQTKIFKHNEKDSTSISSNQIAPLYEDSRGILWVGTLGGGLCSLERQTGRFRRYPYITNQFNTATNNALDDGLVLSICEDKQGTLWVGTLIGGLNRFDRESGTFTSYQNQPPGFVTVSTIFEDSKGQLWAGTMIGGELFLVDRKTITAKKFGEKDGLLEGGIFNINEDNSGNLWITSEKGISIVDIQTKKISRLTSINGLPEEPESNLSFYKTKQGRFLMPCYDGFISFDPARLKADTALPVVHIESVEFTKLQKEKNKQTDSIMYVYGKDKINLHYNENRITFSYVGLQYQNSALNQYAYKLEGYDEDWIQGGTRRNVTYTNLSPATYVFHVKAANSDGVWNPQEQTITVIISPPWWFTWWAYLVYAVIFLVLLRSYIAIRSRSLRKQNRLLEEKVEQRTHQLSEANEELKVSRENIEAQRDELANTVDVLKSTQAQLIQSEKMASLGQLTAGIAHEIQNPLNFVNNFSEVNNELIEEMRNELSVMSDESPGVNDGGINSVNLELLNDIYANNEKIVLHGKRADAIVKGMLEHSRQGTGEKQLTDINALADEYLKLAYNGLRAKDKLFNATLKTDFDNTIGKINIVAQDIGRVLLNLYNNAFYAVREKAASSSVEHSEYQPQVTVNTRKTKDGVEILVQDNGPGIPDAIKDKIFQPFFTTKPTGQGTGLGLSLAYDIMKAHGGEIKVESKQGSGTEFIIMWPE